LLVATSPPPPDRRPEVTTHDALRFLATMKRELADDTKKYDEFITVVVEFKDGRSVTRTILAD
jgi:histone deacetylase complex regulatory component SIN3